MTYIDEDKKPEVMGAGNFIAAVVIHLLFFAVLFVMGNFSFADDEVVIPIDLTVVVKENLDGNEDEPPPLEDPAESEPEPEPPKPEPEQPKPEPPPPPQESVIPVEEKKPEPPKKVEPKPEPPKKVEPKPEPPKKTAAQLREEKLKKMRESAKDVERPKPPKEKPKPPQPNGKTGPKRLTDEEIKRLLNQGYKPGTTEQIAPNEESRCLGLVKLGMDEKWREISPQIGKEGVVKISIRFDKGGRIVSSAIKASCGDSVSDAAALKVVRSVGSVRGLSSMFLDKYSKESITLLYSVRSGR
ncbi:MAG: energy transducer TonB [Kiritimatiellae bacterium]|nr:energy transducer TonB [Kiritimatiellia bacterium]